MRHEVPAVRGPPSHCKQELIALSLRIIYLELPGAYSSSLVQTHEASKAVPASAGGVCSDDLPTVTVTTQQQSGA